MRSSIVRRASFAITVLTCIVITSSLFIVPSGNALADESSKDSNVSMYVISSIKTTAISKKHRSSETVAYKYNKSGQLIKRESKGKVLEKFTYKNGALTSMWRNGGSSASGKVKYTYKGGKLTKSSDSSSKITIRFSANKKGKISKLVRKYSPRYSVSTSYKYSKKGGRIISGRYGNWKHDSFSFTYDPKGNPKQVKEFLNDSSKCRKTNFKNTYKDGRLVKVVSGSGSSKTTVTIKYKKINVSASDAPMVERQQKSIPMLYIFDRGLFLYGIPLGFC